jgi:anti-sigma factor RsiW
VKACATYAPMIGARPGELTGEEQRGLEAHLAACPACRARAADLDATEGLVSEALLARANARDFSAFVDGVMARVDPVSAHPERSSREAAAKSKGRPESFDPAAAPQRLRSGQAESKGGFSGLLAWLASHRRLALGALAPALALALAVVYVRERSDHDTIAALELYTEGEVTMVLQTRDGPVVLLGEEAGG